MRVQHYDFERLETRIDSTGIDATQAGYHRSAPSVVIGPLELDTVRLQKLATISGLAIASWVPILSLVMWLAR